MLGILQDIARETYRSIERKNRAEWSKLDTSIADRLRKYPAIHSAELPTSINIESGSTAPEAIIRTLSQKYSEISLEKIENEEKSILGELLKHRGFLVGSYEASHMKASSKITKLPEKKIIIKQNSTTLLFDEKHLDFIGTEEITSTGGRIFSRYYFGPTDIIVSNNKNKAFNLSSLPGWGVTKISLNEPIAHFNRKISTLDMSDVPDSTYNELYLYPVIAHSSYYGRLTEQQKTLVSIPLVVLAHELGHSNQTEYFHSELYPTNTSKREANATYFALRLVRRLREHDIDIASNLSNGDLVSIMEQGIYMHDFEDFDRLKRRTGKSPQDIPMV